MSSKSSYTKQLTVCLNDLRKQNELCDVTIHVSMKTFPAHRAVLAAASSYFRAMFASGFRESTDKEVNIDGDPDIFEELLNYAYTGHMKVTSTTAYCLLEMACYLQFTDICQHCPKFLHLSSSLPITDMLNMYELASSHEYPGMKTLASEIMKHICSYVQDMKSSAEFLETADVSFLKVFLRQDDLSSEEDVLEMVISWLKCDWDTRRQHTIYLLENVRLGLVPEDRLKELMDSEIRDIPECQQLLQRVIEGLSSDDSKIVRAMNDPDLFSRRGTITAPITLIISPYDENDFIFKYFDFNEKNWKEMSKFTPLPFKTSLIVANDTLYAIGGFRTYYNMGPHYETKRRQFWKYNALHNQWNELPSMKTATSYSQSVFTDGFIYQIGDADGGKKVERFDVTKETWEKSTPLPERFSKCTSAVDYQGNLIVYGIRRDTPGTHVIVSFSPKLNIWQTEMLDEVEFDQSDEKYPTLFRHAGSIYIILYKVSKSNWFRCEPVVNILEVQLEEGRIARVSLGHEVKQDMIPATSLGAFRIQEQVFVNVHESVLLTRLNIKQNQNEELPRELLELHTLYEYSSNIVNFTFEKKLCINNASQGHGSDAYADEVDKYDSTNDEDWDEDDG